MNDRTDELIREIRISRNVKLMSDTLLALQRHVILVIDLEFKKNSPNFEGMKDSIDSLFLNPLELYAFCINNRYIDDDGFFKDAYKSMTMHQPLDNYPSLKEYMKNLKEASE